MKNNVLKQFKIEIGEVLHIAPLKSSGAFREPCRETANNK